jgi:hypothetical protein
MLAFAFSKRITHRLGKEPHPTGEVAMIGCAQGAHVRIPAFIQDALQDQHFQREACPPEKECGEGSRCASVAIAKRMDCRETLMKNRRPHDRMKRGCVGRVQPGQELIEQRADLAIGWKFADSTGFCG